MKKLYIFDLDGTLVDTIQDLAAACNYALQETGHQTLPVEDYPALVGNGIYNLMARALRQQGIEAEADGPEVQAMTPHFKGYYDQHLTDQTRPYPGMHDLLRQLQQEGANITVASNKYQAATEVIVNRLFPDIHFSAVLGQREGHPKKPDPSIVQELMISSGVSDPSEVIYWGDSNVDLETARAAGVDFHLVDWGFGYRWVACWGTATSIADRHESTYTRNLTLRYPIFCPFSGQRIRLHFSNRTGTEPVMIEKISLQCAVYQRSTHGAPTEHPRSTSYTEPTLIPVGEERVIELPLEVQAGDTIRVSFYLKDFTEMRAGTLVTGPLSGGQFAYGDYCEADTLPLNLTKKTNWYWFLNTIDILTDRRNHAVICYGDSITAQSWPDYLAQQLWQAGKRDVSIVRRAVCGTRILRQYDCIQYQAYGLQGSTRFPQELQVAGATAVIIQHGINDIIHPVGTEVNPFRPMSDLPTAQELCDAIQHLYIDYAHQHNPNSTNQHGLQVYLGTLLPIEGWRTYAPFREELRQQVNQWMRNLAADKTRDSQTQVTLIDFDQAVRDESHPTAFRPGFDSGDHLHPSEAAYKAMATAARKTLLLLLFLFTTLVASAGITTYSFTSKNWASNINNIACDNSTDGWTCEQAASDYSLGYSDAQGQLYSAGVSVKTGTSGAGAVSVLTFQQVRQVNFNLCLNSSKGRGIIYVQVGDDAPWDSLVINKPVTSGSGVYNRDSIVQITGTPTGHIRFRIVCTENAINIHSITIRAQNGGSSPFTQDTYQLVTDIHLLQDSDQIIIGVADGQSNRLMGYYDETVSQNNIHSVSGRYSSDRTQVSPNDEAVYTLRKTLLNGDTSYLIIDQLRYDNAYLVASGGKTKNRLGLWVNPYDSKTYGYYGYWDIQIAPTGTATIMSLGNSLGRYIQYNAGNTPTLFGCYQQPGMQTAVCIYHRVPALGDEKAIFATMANFGTLLLTDDHTAADRSLRIQANKLSEDIQATLLIGTNFTISKNQLDRDGEDLVIHFMAPSPGTYHDTLLLQAEDTVETRVPILAQVVAPMTIREAVAQADYSNVYLRPVQVTKKYDTNIYIRDTTGSMMLYDSGNGTGGRYGSGLKKGDWLSGVIGRSRNYYGLPELTPTAQFSTDSTNSCLPDSNLQKLDSADVCRYVQLDSIVVNTDSTLSWKGQTYHYADKFLYGTLRQNDFCQLEAIVSYDWNRVVLYPISQTLLPSTALEEHKQASHPDKFFRNGKIYIRHGKNFFGISGGKIW